MNERADLDDPLVTQLRDAKSQLRETTASYRAAKEELERAKQRIEREAERNAKRDRASFLASFIDVLDDVDRAVAIAAEQAAERALIEGLELLRRRFLAKLGEHGVDRYEPRGNRFDPYRDEAMSVAPVGSAAEDGVVVDVVSPGYTLDADVLRPARVIVGRFTPATP